MTTTRLLELADLRLRLRFPAHSMLERVDERYEGFLLDEDDAPAELELDFHIDPEARPEGFHPVWVRNPPIRSEGDMERALLRGEGFEGDMDWSRGRCRVRIPDALAYVDLAVRVALGVELLRRGDTLLHAAAVLRDRWGLIFSGPSGAGKSTIARICQESGLELLADEMVALRRYGAGLRTYGTAFWHGSRATGPAAAIFLLEQSERPSVTRIPADRALPAMLRAGGAPLDLPAVQEAFFHALGNLLRRVPAYRLAFAPDPGFWAAVDQLPEFSFFRPRPRLFHVLPSLP